MVWEASRGAKAVLGGSVPRPPGPLGVAVTVAELAYFVYRVAREVEKDRRRRPWSY